MIKRLIGFLVVLVFVVILLALLPRPGRDTRSQAVPVAAVPIGETGMPTSEAAPATSVAATTAATPSTHRDIASDGGHASAVAAAPASGSGPSPDHGAGSGASTAAPAADQARAAEPATGSGNYYVQVASFRDSDNAATALARLEARGYHGIVRVTTVDGRTWHRVQLGPYATAAMAQTAQRRMTSQGYKGTRITQTR